MPKITFVKRAALLGALLLLAAAAPAQGDDVAHKRTVDTQISSLQTSRLAAIRTQYRLAIARRDRRLVAIYETGKPSALDLVLGARSIDDVLEATNFATLIGKEDLAIATEVARAKAMMIAARKRTAAARTSVAGETRVIAARE